MLKLYSYFRSSASYRVRIALHWKQLAFEYIPVHLVKNGGEQNAAEYRRVNPMGHVPSLNDSGFLIAESVAIIDYLEHIKPSPALFPSEPKARAKVLQLCELINSGIQPLQNLKVIQYLEKNCGQTKASSDQWMRHWIEEGLGNMEKILASTAGSFCVGGEITAADCFLIPQCFSSRRFGVTIENYPLIASIEANALKLDAFKKAHPAQQPDFQP